MNWGVFTGELGGWSLMTTLHRWDRPSAAAFTALLEPLFLLCERYTVSLAPLLAVLYHFLVSSACVVLITHGLMYTQWGTGRACSP